MADHVHEFYLDADFIQTDDGPPQPRRSIFIECLKCKLILRDNQIVEFFNVAMKMEPFKEWADE